MKIFRTVIVTRVYIDWFGIPDMKVFVVKRKGKGKGLDTCYSATYTSQTRDQQRFAIS